MRIAYDEIGARESGRPVILVHGFTSNRQENWQRLGWYGAFERKRIRCVALDCRGHGESAKPHDPVPMRREKMVGDVFALMDHLGARADLLGYSMGARIVLAAALAHPERVPMVIAGGIGGRLFEPAPPGNPMADAMDADDPAAIAEPMLRSFRQFADEQGEDRKALAACARAATSAFTRDDAGGDKGADAHRRRIARRAGGRSARSRRRHSRRAGRHPARLRSFLGDLARAVQRHGDRFPRRGSGMKTLLAAACLLFATPALAACNLSAPDIPHAGPGCGRRWMNANLHVNDIVTIGTHNSYKQAIDPKIMKLIASNSKEVAQTLDYSHIPLDQQLDDGARALELDVAYDPDGHLFANPLGPRLMNVDLPDGYAAGWAMAAPGFKVLHAQDFDFRSSCLTFVECLTIIKTWSDAHPDHIPILITMNAKDDSPVPQGTQALKFDTAAFDALDAEIASVFAPKDLITPDDVRGDYATLRQAVLEHGWPTLGKSRGKVLFAMDEDEPKISLYRGGHARRWRAASPSSMRARRCAGCRLSYPQRSAHRHRAHHEGREGRLPRAHPRRCRHRRGPQERHRPSRRRTRLWRAICLHRLHGARPALRALRGTNSLWLCRAVQSAAQAGALQRDTRRALMPIFF